MNIVSCSNVVVVLLNANSLDRCSASSPKKKNLLPSGLGLVPLAARCSWLRRRWLRHWWLRWLRASGFGFRFGFAFALQHGRWTPVAAWPWGGGLGGLPASLAPVGSPRGGERCLSYIGFAVDFPVTRPWHG